MAPPRRLSDEQRRENRRTAKAKWLANNRAKRLEVQRAYNARAKHKRHAYYLATKDKTMASSRKRREQNPRLRKEEYRRWKERNPSGTRAEHNLRNVRKYGLTKESYRNLVALQKGVCALCGNPQLPRLDVDHDHETGAVRGLLCRRCNGGVGAVERFLKLDLLVSVRTYIAASKALTLVA